MKSRKPVTPFSPHEIKTFVMPLILASILVLAGIIYASTDGSTTTNWLLVVCGIVGILYLLVTNTIVIRYVILRRIYSVINAVFSGIGLGILSLILPDGISEASHIVITFGVLAVATMSGRVYAYLTMLAIIVVSLPKHFAAMTTVGMALEYFTPLVVSVVVMEVIIRLQETANEHIHRLETINKVSREIMQTLDTKQTISLLDSTIHETLIADTYFIGIRKGDEIELELFFDDKEYFNGTRIPLDGTLSGWVIKNEKELYLPDLQDDVDLEGVKHFVMGSEKTSLSWIGVPLKAENVTGVLALSSYTPNAFDRADLELLSNLGQHVTLALDNTIKHALVEQQARLDSLTGVYNHEYFLKQLAERAKEADESNTLLSLIMLDIDYFKQFNDTYGHLVGDRILEALCTAIKHNIKQNDAVGRWGGEEFAISLPGADGAQALQIAKRISQTLGNLRVEDLEHKTVPIPTISQGIAVYPIEANEIYHLVDAADRRLYVAKERGRNQIEPGDDFWKN
ncbi:MAG: GGDEF domain-containing protein [Anaerolineales bacterium]|nr:GGDEF domain-containing protein [Anaerolineales bacterium]